MRRSSVPDSAVPLLGWVFLGAIILTSAIGFSVAVQIEGHAPTIANEKAWLLTGFLLAAAIVTTIHVRFFALPMIAKQDDMPLGKLATLGYMFAESPAMFGTSTAIISGQGWRVLPFTVVALIFWGLVRSFLRGLQPAAKSEFPRL